ncbi:MAG: ATP-binding protein [Dehalococcoidia bacterium]|nr:ATP-binding protein [Dehalococcoidia bacterium]
MTAENQLVPEKAELGGKRLGMVVEGSLSMGLKVRLDRSTFVEDMSVGRYVTIRGQKDYFLGMVTGIELGAADDRLASSPLDAADPFIVEAVAGSATYGLLHVMPQVKLGRRAIDLTEGAKPVKTVPAHFSAVWESSQRDIELVFGKEDERRFYLGTPLDMETQVCLDLVELTKRSNGVFGKSGTGKTFLTRLLLIGILQKGAAVNLVFDMHSEYGWEGRSETNYKVKGLKQLFPSKTAILTLDEESTRRRKVSPDGVVKIGYGEIEPEDIELLRQTLNLTEPSVQAVYQFSREFGRDGWLSGLLARRTEEETAELLARLNVHESTYRNLLRGMERLRRLPFLVDEASHLPVQRIMEYLDRGVNVVLEFGRVTSPESYILVANMLTRRIHEQYVERTEMALGEGRQPPRPLVITLEEAHRFLSHEVAEQTIFGRIAREMRKYNVTLLVIDQRPSGIDEEVMSQLGTKITCLLDNERDIDSVLTGVAGKSELKGVLARLESKQQALIFGHAVPVPVVIRTREYGSADSYRGLGVAHGADAKRRSGEDAREVWEG